MVNISRILLEVRHSMGHRRDKKVTASLPSDDTGGIILLSHYENYGTFPRTINPRFHRCDGRLQALNYPHSFR